VADASHELRTPLTSIRGFAELYRQGAMTDPAEVADVLRRIEDESKRMGLLVDDLLLLARLDQQRPFARDPVDLVILARDAADAGRIVAQDRTVTLEAPDTPVVVPGDDGRLRHLVTNLVENALRHTPAGTPVEVHVGYCDRHDRRWAEVAVTDHGNGLTPEQAARVFERFYRTDAARSRKGPSGAGLGLSIVKAVAAAHGGIAEVDTAPGQGATFRVLLPVADAELPTPASASASNGDGPAANGGGSGGVEDDEVAGPVDLTT
jgi:two-component system OmpR family sensor kinase